MKSIRFILPSRPQKFFGRLALLASVIVSFACFGQIQEIEVSPTIQSGIVQSIDENNKVGIVQFKIEDLDAETAQTIYRELKKYEGEIIGYGQAVIAGKIIVSYVDPMYPNFILAILDRVNIKGYYELNGTVVYYQKDGRSAFIR